MLLSRLDPRAHSLIVVGCSVLRVIWPSFPPSFSTYNEEREKSLRSLTNARIYAVLNCPVFPCCRLGADWYAVEYRPPCAQSSSPTLNEVNSSILKEGRAGPRIRGPCSEHIVPGYHTVPLVQSLRSERIILCRDIIPHAYLIMAVIILSL